MKRKTIRIISAVIAAVMAVSTIVYVNADEQGSFLTKLTDAYAGGEDSAVSDSAVEAEVIDNTVSESSGEAAETESILSGSALTAVISADLTDEAEVVISGSCGDNAEYTLYDNGELVISGTEDMTNYSYSSSNRTSNTPWVSYKSDIKSAVIESGITSIGNYAFYECRYLETITIPDSVTSIGSAAFNSCSALTEITIPDTVTSIGDQAFGNLYISDRSSIAERFNKHRTLFILQLYIFAENNNTRHRNKYRQLCIF